MYEYISEKQKKILKEDDFERRMKTFWLGAHIIKNNEEYVHLYLHVGLNKEKLCSIENLIACDNLKQIISEALLHDKTLKEIPLEMRSTNIGAFLSKKIKQETTNVILEKAGPSLNMKITGPQSRILFDCDFLLSFPLVFWPSPASEWIHRARCWPDQATIQRLASLPCHVIAKQMTEGHRYTWRFSFSRQVR